MGVRNKIKICSVIILLIAMMGIASAVPENKEEMDSKYVAPNIHTDVWNLKPYTGNGTQKYVLIYIAPNTLNCNSPSPTMTCNEELKSLTVPNPLPDGWYEGDIYTFGPDNPNPLGHTYSENWNPGGVAGTWVVVLYHGGGGETFLQSHKIDTPVEVPIPEFPTIALPIAAVMGLLFVFQSRKKKEE